MSMSNRVHIVTDSNCDLPAPLLMRYGITSFPTSIWFGNDRFWDGVDIDNDTFYARLARGEQPRNGPPDRELMRRTYLELASDGAPIVSIHVSHQYRETAEVARQLAAELKGRAEIEVFDTFAVSLAEGLLALRAGILAESGASFTQIADVMRHLIPRTHALITLSDIDYPLRGGKMTRFQHLVSSVTGLKPVVGLTADGVIGLVGHAFSPERALEELLRLMDERLSYPREQILGVIHTRRPQEAEALRDQLQAKYEPQEIIVAESGAGAGTQTGPGALGVAFFSETARV